MSELDQLYEHDFYSWALRQAEALRRADAERVNTSAPIDWLHLAEEVEDMGKEQADKLESVLRVLLLHLLKWGYQPEARSASWRGSIVEQRRRAVRLWRKNPDLRPQTDELVRDAYADARDLRRDRPAGGGRPRGEPAPDGGRPGRGFLASARQRDGAGDDRAPMIRRRPPGSLRPGARSSSHPSRAAPRVA